MTWRDALKSNPLPWLLEPEPPSVRYWALRDLLDQPAEHADVLAAQEAIPTWPPLAELLAAQERDGYWVKRDYYLPKHTGTFWVLTLLADLGLTNEHEQVRRACDYMFGFQQEHGPFWRRRRIGGKGIDWDTRPEPCTYARIVRFLIQFGYGDDPRVRAAIGWLLAAQREDGMWDCSPRERPGCLRASLDILRVAAIDRETADHPATAPAAAALLDLLMEPRMARYHVGVEWTTLEYPYFHCSVISALDALARLGHSREHPKIAAALDYLLSRQLVDGGWPLDRRPRQLPFDVGQIGEPNKWLTLDALRVVKLLCS